MVSAFAAILQSRFFNNEQLKTRFRMPITCTTYSIIALLREIDQDWKKIKMGVCVPGHTVVVKLGVCWRGWLGGGGGYAPQNCTPDPLLMKDCGYQFMNKV